MTNNVTKNKKSNSILVESHSNIPTQSTCSISKHTSSQSNYNINNSKKVSQESSQFNTISNTYDNENKFNYDNSLNGNRIQDTQYLNRM